MATAIYRPDSIPGPEIAHLAISPSSLAGLRALPAETSFAFRRLRLPSSASV